LELVTRERERFVVKPNDDYGGAGVMMGSDATDREWKDKITAALDKFYVVQERAPVERVQMPVFDDERIELIEHLVDFDPFLFNNKVEGGIVRLAQTSLSNVSAGGGVTALLVIE
jgi:uncharacterized circularly permuted ATP-grasp superfamily protein